MLLQDNKLLDLYLQHFGNVPEKIMQLKGDGSDRSIYRLLCAEKSVIGIYGENRAENLAFIQFSRYFAKHNLPVPQIYVAQLDNGIYLEEDLGHETLFDRISKLKRSNRTVLNLYRNIIEWLIRFQILGAKDFDYSYCYQYPRFLKEAMLWDLQYFRHRFLAVFEIEEFKEDELQKDFSFLAGFLSQAESRYFLYRDFQSRNIMLKNDHPYFIDYQSGRRGALQYDLASLLYDAKAKLPQNLREELIDFYLEYAGQKANIDSAEFMQYFYGFALLRILQALGAFGFLAKVKGKMQFKAGIPLAISNIELLVNKVSVLNKLPTLRMILLQLIKGKDEKQFEGTNI